MEPVILPVIDPAKDRALGFEEYMNLSEHLKYNVIETFNCSTETGIVNDTLSNVMVFFSSIFLDTLEKLNAPLESFDFFSVPLIKESVFAQLCFGSFKNDNKKTLACFVRFATFFFHKDPFPVPLLFAVSALMKACPYDVEIQQYCLKAIDVAFEHNNVVLDPFYEKPFDFPRLVRIIFAAHPTNVALLASACFTMGTLISSCYNCDNCDKLRCFLMYDLRVDDFVAKAFRVHHANPQFAANSLVACENMLSENNDFDLNVIVQTAFQEHLGSPEVMDAMLKLLKSSKHFTPNPYELLKAAFYHHINDDSVVVEASTTFHTATEDLDPENAEDFNLALEVLVAFANHRLAKSLLNDLSDVLCRMTFDCSQDQCDRLRAPFHTLEQLFFSQCLHQQHLTWVGLNVGKNLITIVARMQNLEVLRSFWANDRKLIRVLLFDLVTSSLGSRFCDEDNGFDFLKLLQQVDSRAAATEVLSVMRRCRTHSKCMTRCMNMLFTVIESSKSFAYLLIQPPINGHVAILQGMHAHFNNDHVMHMGLKTLVALTTMVHDPLHRVLLAAPYNVQHVIAACLRGAFSIRSKDMAKRLLVKLSILPHNKAILDPVAAQFHVEDQVVDEMIV